MRGMLAVLKSDVDDILRSKGFLIIAIILGVVTIGAAVGINIPLSRWLNHGLPWNKAKPLLELFMGLAVNYMPLIVLYTFMATWATDPIAREKARGTLESLLATPLTAKAVWMGKSLAIFLPAYIISILSTLVVVLAMNFASILPATGHFVLPLPTAVTGFLFLPLLMFALISLGVLVSFITNPVIGQTIIIFIGVVLLNLVGQVGGRIIWLLPSWDYAFYNLAGAALLGTVALRISSSLTKEKIVLSSKGRWAQ
ncbi:MAG: ABC transporter permease subunit [Actinomycetota bacterium]|nr:ABC transporter permease subunit [Actinomycetota bacterium]